MKHEDVRGDKIVIRRMLRAATREVIDDTKGTFGEREVVLTDKALEIIAAADTRKKELGIENEYLFSLTEKPLSYDALKKLYPSFCQKLGIISKSSHKSRKTYASALVDGNINLNTIREFLGHIDERTTLNNYCYDRNTDTERKEKVQKALAS